VGGGSGLVASPIPCWGGMAGGESSASGLAALLGGQAVLRRDQAAPRVALALDCFGRDWAGGGAAAIGWA